MNNILPEKDTKVVFEILIAELDVKESQLTPDARIQEDLGADSLTVVEITMALEERFDVSIPDEEWETVSTVEDILNTLAKLLAQKR